MTRCPLAWILALLIGLNLSPVAAADPDPFEPAAKLVELERYYEAIPLIEKALKDRPKDPRGHVLLGKIYFSLSRFKACRESFDICLAQDAAKYESTASAFLARIAYLECDYDGARTYLGRAERDEKTNRELSAFVNLEGVQRKQTAHYQIYVDDALAKAGGLDSAAVTMEAIFECYSKIFPLKVEKIYAPIVIISDRAKFDAAHEALLSEAPHPDHVANLHGDLRILLVHNNTQMSPAVAGGLSDLCIRFLYSLSFSQFRQMLCPAVMPWFEYGLGLYTSEAEFEKGKPKLGTFRKTIPDSTIPTKYQDTKAAIQDRQFLPLSAFLTIDYEEFIDMSGGRAHANMAQAWSFAHFLLHCKQYPKGKKLLVDYFVAFHEGRTRQEAYAKTFGTVDMAKLEAAWRKYIEAL